MQTDVKSHDVSIVDDRSHLSSGRATPVVTLVSMRRATVLLIFAGLAGACSLTAPAATGTTAPPVETCEEAFRQWVDIAAS